jgi:hypothetical protein
VLAPFVFLFGTMWAFVELNRRSELIAMRAAGVSAWRFIMPAAMASFVIGLLSITLLNPLTTAMTAKFETERDALMNGYLKETPKGTWLRQGDDKTQIVIRARARDVIDGSVRLKGVSLFVYTLNTKGVMDFTRRIEANEARLEPGFWRLTGVREATPGAGAIRSDSLSIPSNLDDRTASERFNTPQAVALWRLPATIQRTEDAGFSAAPFKLRLQQDLATPHVVRGDVGAGGGVLAAPDAPGGPRRPGRLRRRAGFRILFLQRAVQHPGQGGRSGPRPSPHGPRRRSRFWRASLCFAIRKMGESLLPGSSMTETRPSVPVACCALSSGAAWLALACAGGAHAQQSLVSIPPTPVVPPRRQTGWRRRLLPGIRPADPGRRQPDHDRRGVGAGRYQGRTLRADKVVYDSKTGAVVADGHVQLVNPDGTAEFADHLELDKDMKAGFARELRRPPRPEHEDRLGHRRAPQRQYPGTEPGDLHALRSLRREADGRPGRSRPTRSSRISRSS